MKAIEPEFVNRVELVIKAANPAYENLVVTNLQRAFGGNSRLAWSLDITFEHGGQLTQIPCILLSQVPGRHVDSDTCAEFSVLQALTGRGISTPGAIALDADGFINGAPAIVMERAEGEADAVKFLRDIDGSSQALTTQLAEKTADLHNFDWRSAGLVAEENSVLGQILQWENTFRENRQEPHPAIVFLFSWLKGNLPEPARLSLVHGDLRPGNFLYQGDQITAILDWEMAHIGDPAEDIAWIYRELWSPSRFLLLGDFLSIYSARHGFDPGQKNVIFYRIFSEIKFAVISLTASNSVAQGKSSNMRHADRAAKVPQCLELCFEFIDCFSKAANHAVT
ncbi:MAG: phosphotransferase family protein [Porticoccaceae bacterium]